MTQTYETAMNPFTGNLRGNRSHGVVHDWIATSQQDADDADDAGDIEASDAAKREGVVGSYDDCASLGYRFTPFWELGMAEKPRLYEIKHTGGGAGMISKGDCW